MYAIIRHYRAARLADLEVEQLGVFRGEVMVSRAVERVLEPVHHRRVVGRMSTRSPRGHGRGAGAVLVTGAASGIGRACALGLAREGFEVFAGVRKAADGQALQDAARGSQGRVTPLLLDVTEADLVAHAAATVAERVGARGLAGLVNNAGIGRAWPVELVPPDELRQHFDVNVFGQVTVTQAFLPLLRAGGGRIVNIGSVGDRITVPFGGPLNACKYALAALNDALRLELRPWGIDVVLVEPGSIRTAVYGKLEAAAEAAIGRFGEQGRRHYETAYRTMVARAVEHERSGSPPEVVAWVVPGR